MATNNQIHLTIMQPQGYIHSQGFLDQARYARYQLRKLGATVTIGKNRLCEDSINIIFGAHLGFPAELRERYTCVFFNLEQLGEGGAKVAQDYLNLLSTSAVIDYDERNLATYGCKSGDVPVVSFQYAPYLANAVGLSWQDRPIDLLFFGSINNRRKAIFERIEACGWSISYFDHPLYGDERDQYIRQSKAIFNCHFYESSRFEQARVFHSLSLGTPVISERTERTTPPAAFENAVSWVNNEGLEAFFRNEFMTAAWQDRAQEQLEIFANSDSSEQWAVAYGYCQALCSMSSAHKAKRTWLPSTMILGSGNDYRLGWLNVDIRHRLCGDVVYDWSEPTELPLRLRTTSGTLVTLEENQFEKILIKKDLTGIPDKNILMSNMLRLLQNTGQLEIEIPYNCCAEHIKESDQLACANTAASAWVRQHIWDLGDFNHRFEVLRCNIVDANSVPCKIKTAAKLLITFGKTETTAREKTKSRAYLSDFGYISEDNEFLGSKLAYENCEKDNSSQSGVLNKARSLKFIFYAPHYDDNSGGLIAIYKLAHMLNNNGHMAKIWHWTRLHSNEFRFINGKAVKEFSIPKNVALADVDCPYPIIEASVDDIHDSIVVYPEIIEGNPLGAKKIVRWLLNKPGILTRNAAYGIGDLLFYYAEHFLPDGFSAEEKFRLKITDMKTYIYKDTYKGVRKGVYYMVRKGADVPHNYHPANAVRVDGMSHAQLAEIFSKAEMFISYDLHTAYSVFASLCGCDSVVVPRAGMTKDQWKVGQDESDQNGIAYGYDDIERARKTRPAMIAQVLASEALNVKAMNNFLSTCRFYLY